jgi:hypothetical protein
MSDKRRATFVYTNSYDATADLVISRLGPDAVFRFNLDLWRDYRIEIRPDGFALEDPTGRRASAESIAKAYWRKPRFCGELSPVNDRPSACEEAFLEDEVAYAMTELVNLLRREGKLVLVEPDGYKRVGKLVQMRVAADLFEVPPWRFVRGRLGPGHFARPVVKSLGGAPVQDRAVLFTSRVDEAELDPASAWFIQEYVPAVADVTVVYVRGDLFAFELARAAFLARTVDWREAAAKFGGRPWTPHCLPARIGDAVRGLMQRLSLDFGRLDLLLREDGRYAFLEVNSNGEWGWLDPEGRYGLLDRIVDELSPTTPVRPLGWRGAAMPHFAGSVHASRNPNAAARACGRPLR